MSDFLIHLAALSLGGGAVALILMLTARFTHARYAARWRCWVWLVLCLRLAVPLPLLPDRPAQQAPIQLPVVEDRVVLRPAPGPAAPRRGMACPRGRDSRRTARARRSFYPPLKQKTPDFRIAAQPRVSDFIRAFLHALFTNTNKGRLARPLLQMSEGYKKDIFG